MKVRLRDHFHTTQVLKRNYKKWTSSEWISNIQIFLQSVLGLFPTQDEVLIVMLFVRRKVLMHRFARHEENMRQSLQEKRPVFYDIMKNPNKSKIRAFFASRVCRQIWEWYCSQTPFYE